MLRRAIFIALTLNLCACSTLVTIDVDHELAGINGAARAPSSPLQVRAGVLPLVVSDDFSNYLRQTNGNPDVYRWVEDVSSSDAKLMQQRIIASMEQSRCFESVNELSIPSLDAALNEAWLQGIDVLFVPRIVRNDVYYVDSNSSWTWNVALWGILTPIASWWVADEEFSADVRIELAAYSVGRRNELFRDTLEGNAQRSLDDWDQGWEWLSIFTTPSTLDAPNWKVISPALRPHGELDLYRNVIDYCRKNFVTRAKPDSFRESLSKFEAVVLWSRPEGWLEPRYAESDAASILEMLRGVREPELTGVQLTTNAASDPATREVLHDAIQRAARLQPYDRLFLSFSGVATVSDGALALVLGGDSNSPAPATVSLAELAQWLAPVRAQTLVVVDAGFNGTRGTRSLPAQARTDFGIEAFDDLRVATNACFLFASSGTTGALEMDEIRGGLFTHFFTQHAKRALVSGEGLDMVDMFAAIQNDVVRYAKLEQVAQEPTMICGDGFDTASFFNAKRAIATDPPNDRDEERESGGSEE